MPLLKVIINIFSMRTRMQLSGGMLTQHVKHMLGSMPSEREKKRRRGWGQGRPANERNKEKRGVVLLSSYLLHFLPFNTQDAPHQLQHFMTLIFRCMEMTNEEVSHKDSRKIKAETAQAYLTWPTLLTQVYPNLNKHLLKQ